MAVVSLLYYIVLISPLLAEAFIYPGIIKNYLHIHPFIFILFGCLISAILRFRFSDKMSTQFAKTGLFLLAPLVTLIAAVLRAIELQHYPNYIFSTMHVDPIQVGLIGLAIYVISIPFLNKKTFQKEYGAFTFALSFMLYHAIFIYWSDPLLYEHIQKEDGIVEYGTFLVFLLTSIITLFSLRFVNRISLQKNKKIFIKLLFIGFFVIWLLVAGEEISWGQRIFNFDTPENLKEVNTQEELNIHNNNKIFPYVYVGYLLVSLYGFLSWIVFKVYHDKVKGFWELLLRLITSRWYLVLLFVPTIVYVSLRLYYGNAVIDDSEELSELYLALGILSVTYLNLRYLKTYHK